MPEGCGRMPGIRHRATAMQGTTVPFHPGAEKFYREAGILN